MFRMDHRDYKKFSGRLILTAALFLCLRAPGFANPELILTTDTIRSLIEGSTDYSSDKKAFLLQMLEQSSHGGSHYGSGPFPKEFFLTTSPFPGNPSFHVIGGFGMRAAIPAESVTQYILEPILGIKEPQSEILLTEESLGNPLDQYDNTAHFVSTILIAWDQQIIDIDRREICRYYVTPAGATLKIIAVSNFVFNRTTKATGFLGGGVAVYSMNMEPSFATVSCVSGQPPPKVQATAGVYKFFLGSKSNIFLQGDGSLVYYDRNRGRFEGIFHNTDFPSAQAPIHLANIIIQEEPAVLGKIFHTDNQRGTVNKKLPLPLQVRVTQNNAPKAGMPVSFTLAAQPVESQGAFLSQMAAVTDSQGFASTEFTLGEKVGNYQIKAACNDCQEPKMVAFNATGVLNLRISSNKAQVRPMIPGEEPESSQAQVTVEATGAFSDPVPNYQVKLEAKANPTSGGHDHGESLAPRPAGKFPNGQSFFTGPTGSDGKLTLTYAASEFGGEETLKVQSASDPNVAPASRALQVKVPNFVLMPEPSFGLYELTGQTGRHLNNHSIATIALPELQSAMLDFYNHPDIEGSETLRLNDMSLVFGGLFDISGTWSTPHLSHRAGQDVDIENLDRLRTLLPIFAEHGWCFIDEGQARQENPTTAFPHFRFKGRGQCPEE